MGRLCVAIDRIEVFVLRASLERPFSASAGRGRHTERVALLVKLTDSDGIVGWGETFQNLSSSIQPMRALTTDVLAPALLNRSPLENLRLWQDAVRLTAPFGGTAARAVGAIDTALWDLRGQLQGLPVSLALGASPSGAFPAIATAVFYGNEPHAVGARLDEVHRLLDAGYRAIKIKVGGLEPGIDLEHLSKIREIVPGEVMLCIDGNSGCSRHGALTIAGACDDLQIYWFEEPLPLSDVAGYRAIATRTSALLAGGQDLSTLADFRPLLEAGALHVVQPSVSAAAGITGALQVANAAPAFNAAFSPTGWGTGILLAASLHVRAAAPTRTTHPFPDLNWVEHDVTGNPLSGVVMEPPAVRDGWIALPDRPGLGLCIDERAVEHLAVARFDVGAA
jgi:D-galactarolactone cycloisomerase